MSYLTTAEEIGLERGLELGLHQGTERLFSHLLRGKFGQLSKTYQERVHHANDETLLHWGERLLTANTLEDVFG